MPIIRTYGCEDCGHLTEVWLTMEQVDDPPPACEHCQGRTAQEFKPVALGGSTVGKAVALAETIAAEDYHVADMTHDTRHGGTPKVRYKDEGVPVTPSTWGAPNALMQTAMAIGAQTRKEIGGSPTDMLQHMLKTGQQKDLIEVSKQRAMKIW